MLPVEVREREREGGEKGETKPGWGRRGPAPALRGQSSGKPFSQSPGPPGDSEPCDQPAAAQTRSPRALLRSPKRE